MKKSILFLLNYYKVQSIPSVFLVNGIKNGSLTYFNAHKGCDRKLLKDRIEEMLAGERNQ